MMSLNFWVNYSFNKTSSTIISDIEEGISSAPSMQFLGLISESPPSHQQKGMFFPLAQVLARLSMCVKERDAETGMRLGSLFCWPLSSPDVDLLWPFSLADPALWRDFQLYGIQDGPQLFPICVLFQRGEEAQEEDMTLLLPLNNLLDHLRILINWSKQTNKQKKNNNNI